MSRLRSGFQAQRSGRLAEALSAYQDALVVAEKAQSDATGYSFAKCFSLTATGLCTEILHGEKAALPYLTKALSAGEELGTKGLAHDGFVDIVGLINDKAWCMQRCSSSSHIGQVARSTGHEAPGGTTSDSDNSALKIGAEMNEADAGGLLRRAHYMSQRVYRIDPRTMVTTHVQTADMMRFRGELDAATSTHLEAATWAKKTKFSRSSEAFPGEPLAVRAMSHAKCLLHSDPKGAKLQALSAMDELLQGKPWSETNDITHAFIAMDFATVLAVTQFSTRKNPVDVWNCKDDVRIYVFLQIKIMYALIKLLHLN